jgi:hypothetical protein
MVEQLGQTLRCVARGSTVDWQFHTTDARIKLKSLYPSIE